MTREKLFEKVAQRLLNEDMLNEHDFPYPDIIKAVADTVADVFDGYEIIQGNIVEHGG